MDLVLEIELELELELELLRKLHLGRLLLKGYALSLKSKHITGHCQEDSLALVETGRAVSAFGAIFLTLLAHFLFTVLFSCLLINDFETLVDVLALDCPLQHMP
jgi:hypothetical protein